MFVVCGVMKMEWCLWLQAWFCVARNNGGANGDPRDDSQKRCFYSVMGVIC